MLLRIAFVLFCLAGAVAPCWAQEAEPEFAMAELTPETARRAFDAYLIIEAKFADAAFEDYDSLENFVLQAPEGKELEAAIRAQGFAGVEAWLPIINSVEFTLGALTDNQEQDVLAQIAEVKADATLEVAEKARIVASLEAAIPSDNNRKVVTDMMADPAYAQKLKSFSSED